MRNQTQPDETSETVSAEVRAMMGRTRSTQKDLAEALDLSQPAISQRLHSRVPWTINELFEAAAFFDCPISDLIPDIRSRWSSVQEVQIDPGQMALALDALPAELALAT